MKECSNKIYLDECHFCKESKAAIKHSQSIGDPIFCGAVDYFGECIWERERHCFVVTQKMLDDEKAHDELICQQMGDMAAWIDANEKEVA
ncbi:hypothetical protein RR21198_4849 [Rhodococcus rhodochrous ATCC 21198]|nr:hypothetical protein RR21198_4849 [Rhodococcus rhodochrous ATCC 21198]